VEALTEGMFGGAELEDEQMLALVHQDIEALEQIIRDDTLGTDERWIYEEMLNETRAVLARLEADAEEHRSS
jgi:hypothetical protein